MIALDSHVRKVAAARSLRGRGAHNVLVTLGAAGALLVTEDGQVLRAPACAIPGGVVVDATGAGDAFRAAFAVALVEGRELEDCLKFAAAAGATAVAKLGAVPSLPSRGECERAEAGRGGAASVVVESPTETPATASGVDTEDAGPCPMKFASRLNSMKDRPDLWDGGTDVMGMVARQVLLGWCLRVGHPSSRFYRHPSPPPIPPPALSREPPCQMGHPAGGKKYAPPTPFPRILVKNHKCCVLSRP